MRNINYKCDECEIPFHATVSKKGLYANGWKDGDPYPEVKCRLCDKVLEPIE